MAEECSDFGPAASKSVAGRAGRRCAAGFGAGQPAAGDGIFPAEMSAEAANPVTAEVVQLRMKIFLRSPLRRKLLARSMRLLDKINGQEVLETTADDALSVAMQNAGGGGGAAGLGGSSLPQAAANSVASAAAVASAIRVWFMAKAPEKNRPP